MCFIYHPERLKAFNSITLWNRSIKKKKRQRQFSRMIKFSLKKCFFYQSSVQNPLMFFLHTCWLSLVAAAHKSSHTAGETTDPVAHFLSCRSATLTPDQACRKWRACVSGFLSSEAPWSSPPVRSSCTHISTWGGRSTHTGVNKALIEAETGLYSPH